MGKVIFDNLGFVLREVDDGPICSTKQLPNVAWQSGGVQKYANLSTSETKKFPKGHTPDNWMAHVMAEVLSVIKYYDDGPKTQLECEDFAKSVWEAWSHEAHNVHMSSRIQPMTAHCQIMLFLPGGLIVRGRLRSNDGATYRSNFVGLNCMTKWGRYEMVIHSILPDTIKPGHPWHLTVGSFVAACKQVLGTHYPFLNTLFDNCVPAQWPWLDSLGQGTLVRPDGFDLSDEDKFIAALPDTDWGRKIRDGLESGALTLSLILAKVMPGDDRVSLEVLIAPKEV